MTHRGVSKSRIENQGRRMSVGLGSVVRMREFLRTICRLAVTPFFSLYSSREITYSPYYFSRADTVYKLLV